MLQEQLCLQDMLPSWSDSQRGVPNGLLRSALFGALARGKRRFLRREPIESVDGVNIVYTGIRLCQNYLDLWECLVHIAREQNLGSRCEVTAYQLLKLLGKSTKGGNREVLRHQLAELQATAIEIRQGRYTYAGSLIEEAYHDEETGRIVIVLNQKIVALFQRDSFTKISWLIRCELSKPLAKWLHGFYSTHRQPFDYTVAKIHQLCGSEAKSIWHFEKETLADALEELSNAFKKHGEYFAYHIEYKASGKSLVSVSRDPSLGLPNLKPDLRHL